MNENCVVIRVRGSYIVQNVNYYELDDGNRMKSSMPDQSCISLYGCDKKSYLLVNMRNILRNVIKRAFSCENDGRRVIRVMIDADVCEKYNVALDCQINNDEGISLVVECDHIAKLMYQHNGGNVPRVIARRIDCLDAGSDVFDIQCDDIGRMTRNSSEKAKKAFKRGRRSKVIIGGR